MELIKEIGAFAGLLAFLGLAVLALLSFTQGRDIRRLRDWAGSAPERDADRKEATSAIAAERAEELRQLEEARTAEQEAADFRDERRRRRESGLAEMTWTERIRESFANGAARLGEPRYLVALFVVVLLVAGGAAYAVLGGDDGGQSKGAGKQAASNGKNAAAQLRPAEIEVTVLNGTTVPGLAATFGDEVEGKGFTLGAVTNSSASFSSSVVMFERGNEPEASRVARALGIDQVQLMTPDIEAVSAGAPVSVVIGEDNASSAG